MPDFAALARSDRMAIVTAPGDEQDIASRVFAAYPGIDEDPVTGSAHAALVPFWAKRLGRTASRAAGEQARRPAECELEGRPGDLSAAIARP